MEKEFFEDQIFTNISPQLIQGSNLIFENCHFLNSELSYADLSKSVFVDCIFQDCNLSLVNVNDTGFQNVRFQDCKLTGINFSGCKDFSLSLKFEGCNLDYAVFYKKKLKGTEFIACSLIEVDFSEADLSKAVFEHSDLNRAVFNLTILKGADLTTATNFIIDPEANSLTKAKFSADTLAGLLTKYDLIVK